MDKWVAMMTVLPIKKATKASKRDFGSVLLVAPLIPPLSQLTTTNVWMCAYCKEQRITS